MVYKRNLERSAAGEKADLLFYRVIEKDGNRMLKPLDINTKVSLKLVRAIADNTVVPTFFKTLSINLKEKGIEPGTKVQLRVRFDPVHELVDPSLKGIKVLCEVEV